MSATNVQPDEPARFGVTQSFGELLFSNPGARVALRLDGTATVCAWDPQPLQCWEQRQVRDWLPELSSVFHVGRCWVWVVRFPDQDQVDKAGIRQECCTNLDGDKMRQKTW